MPERHIERREMDSGNTAYLHAVSVGKLPDDAPGHQMMVPAARPGGGLCVITRCPAGCQHDQMMLGSWKHFAVLAGQLAGWRDQLPLNVRDQYDAMAAEEQGKYAEGIRKAAGDA